MSKLFLTPQPTKITTENQAMFDRARVKLIDASTLRDLITYQEDSDLMVIGHIPSGALSVAVRHLDQLFDTVPTVITGFPDTPYPPEWLVISASLPSVQFAEIETVMLKSSNTGATPAQATDLALGVAPDSPSEGINPHKGKISFGSTSLENTPDHDDDPDFNAYAVEGNV